MSANAIRVESVSKRYEVFANQRSRLLHAVWPAHRDGVEEVWALRDVSFEVARGESLAVIGRNGGGKSTLLQILTGVLEPTAGAVEVNGRVCALLELGSGFHPEYTGRENVILNGLLIGLSREEILRRFDEIADFAEIGAAIERPVKTYSSGMLVRLAFAVQVLTDPEILVVDEALSVGDFFFQQKCFGRIRALREKGVTLVFVSHDLGSVRDLCSTALYLREGRVVFSGDSKAAIQRYLREEAARAQPSGGAPRQSQGSLPPVPSTAAVWARPASWVPGPLLAVEAEGPDGTAATRLRIGQTLRLRVHFTTQGVEPGHISVVVKNRYDQIVSTVGSYTSGMAALASDSDAPAVFELDIDMMLEAGPYSLMVAFGRAVASNRGEPVEDTGWIGPFEIEWDYESERAPFLGMFGLPVSGRIVAAYERAGELTGALR